MGNYPPNNYPPVNGLESRAEPKGVIRSGEVLGGFRLELLVGGDLVIQGIKVAGASCG